jgi:hypothetical protein
MTQQVIPYTSPWLLCYVVYLAAAASVSSRTACAFLLVSWAVVAVMERAFM